MKSYANPFSFRRALEDRLNAISKAEGIDLQRMRRQVAFDRLLARLYSGENPEWILKGGYALELKFSRARSTRDLDMGLADKGLSPEVLLEALQAAAARDTGDFFVFEVGESSMDLDGAPYGGTRHPVAANLDGRLFARFHLDIGMGDIQRKPYEWATPRDWLDFAGVTACKIPSISREEHFAQKLHAYTMPREGRTNSRVKDLFDLVLLIDEPGLDAERLKRDLADTFRRRGTHEVPEMLKAPPDFWEPVFRKLAVECDVDGDISAQFTKVACYYRTMFEG